MDSSLIDTLVGDDKRNERIKNKLQKMVVGAYCVHQTWGLGQIKGYNPATKKIIIDFAEKTGQEMDPLFCAKKLEILDNDSLLVQFHNDPEGVRQKLKKSSISLLIEYIETMPNKQASLGDIERTFADIVEKKNFRRWWSVTKKLIAKDGRLMLEEGNVTYIKMRESPISIEEQIIEKFRNTHSATDRLPIAEEISEIASEGDIMRETADLVIDVLSSYAAPDFLRLSAGDKLRACLIRNKLAKATNRSIDSLEPKIESIIHECANLVKIAQELPHGYHLQFFNLITRTFPDEWEKHFLNLLKNGNDRFVSDCISYLCENGREETVKQQLVKWLHEKNLKTPLLQWIIKSRHSKKFESVVSDELMQPELLRAILWAIDNEFLTGTSKSRKIYLAELVCEDRTLIHDLLSSATEEEALDLAQTLMVNQGFDSLSKKSLLARFIALFPSVQNLITASTSKAKSQTELFLKVSKESLDNKRKEYEVLVKEKIPANKAAIATAREHGDLSENSEYKMARQDQETLLARKAQLESELQVAQVIDFENVDTTCVSIGTVVTIKQQSGDEHSTITILGAWDSDPEHNVVSYKTPLAQTLLSQKIGDIVETSIDEAKEQWIIEKIEKWAPMKRGK
ncbi:MAG: GreA/GreB family elongation factor [Opitutales bacterium]|nr:GreA/GreB family elongation factor [Opitutales bacterium]